MELHSHDRNDDRQAFKKRMDIDALLDKARELAKVGAYEAAQAELAALLLLEPEHEMALGLLGAIYAELKQSELAAAHFRRVLDFNAGNALARFQLGLALLDAGKPHEALDSWRAGEYADSRYLVDYYSGIALLQLGRLAEAAAMFQQARMLMPVDHVLYPELLAHMMRLSQ